MILRAKAPLRDSSGDTGTPVTPFAVGAIHYHIGSNADIRIDDRVLLGTGEILIKAGVVNSRTAQQRLDPAITSIIIMIDTTVSENLGVVITPDVE